MPRVGKSMDRKRMRRAQQEDAALVIACKRLATEAEEQAKHVDDDALWPELPGKAFVVRAYLLMLAKELRERIQP